MSISLVTLRREEFAGRTDIYAPPTIADEERQILSALAGKEPLVVNETIFSTESSRQSIERLANYSRYWDFYFGRHYDTPYYAGDRKVVVNYCRKVVHKSVSWFVANGFSIATPKGNEPLGVLLDLCWKASREMEILFKMGMFASVTGDAFLYVTTVTDDVTGQQRPAIFPLNPAYCFPVWNESDPSEMAAFMLQYPIVVGGKPQIFSMTITPTEIVAYLNKEEKDRKPNPLGMVNVVHVPNIFTGVSPYGVSDLHEIGDLNLALNDVTNAISRIVGYYGEPTTVIFGSRFQNIERASNKVWSNLPKDAKIETLELKGDLRAVIDYRNSLRQEILELAEIPQMSLDASDMRISNTTGLALKLMFLPLVEKTSRKQIPAQVRFVKVNEIVLKTHEKILGDSLTALADNPDQRYLTDIRFTSILPRDTQAELDMIVKKLAAGLLSKAEAIRMLSSNEDMQRIALELAADNRSDLFMAYERQKAAQCVLPNESAVFLGSPFLSEDLLEIAGRMPVYSDKDRVAKPGE